MVGLRVFDIGALIVWLVWFFRLREDDDDSDDFRGGGSGDAPEPEVPKGPGGLGVPLPDAEPWPTRRRDHGGDRAPGFGGGRPERRRAPEPVPARAPARHRVHS